MVGFFHSPTIEAAIREEKEDVKVQPLSDSKKPSTLNDPLDLTLPEIEDVSLSFSDSFLDFDSINRWFIEGNPEENMSDLGAEFDLGRGELGPDKEVCGDRICKIVELKEGLGENEASLGQEKGESGVIEKIVEMGSEKVDVEGRDLGGCGWLIQEQLEKVSLEGESKSLVPIVDENVGSDLVGVIGNGIEIKIDENVGDEGESGSDVESEDESSSSSSDSDEEEEEDENRASMSGEVEAKNEVEDGEIMLSDVDETVIWSDIEDVDDDGGGSGKPGPIKSKNELNVLPPVPLVNVTLQPHHETLPVGIILSIIGPQVIVEGVEKHNPLNEGSILWITESRSPLGLIDEIFGPVKNPYYIVRYNSEDEIPQGIQQGTLISFVSEFADHVLNDKSLYQKGYDASGENDEELSDGIEFSDDEKEAEYRRMLKMKKRETNANESKPGNRKKGKRQLKNQKGNWKNNRDLGDKLPVIAEGQHLVPTSLSQDNHQSSSGLGHGLGGDQARSQFPAPSLSAANETWTNVFPHHQPLNLGLPNGLPPNGMLWMQMQQNLPYQLYQTPLQTNAAFQQQISTMPGLPLNFNGMGGQPNFGLQLNPAQFGMGLQVQQAPLPLYSGGEQAAIQSQGSQNSHSQFNFNQGRGGGGGGGRRGYHGGRGRFGGGRGRHQSYSKSLVWNRSKG